LLSSLFFLRLVPNRPDFVMTMTADEQAIMGAHAAFLQEQLAAGTLEEAGPVTSGAGLWTSGGRHEPSMPVSAAISVSAAETDSFLPRWARTCWSSARSWPSVAFVPSRCQDWHAASAFAWRP